MSSTRRDFVRQSAAAAAGAVAGIPIEAISQGTVPQAGSAQLTGTRRHAASAAPAAA
jgi:nitrate reductase NapA